ncbi:MAG: hypothetical protein ACQEUS_16665 [Bacillota bacterium]
MSEIMQSNWEDHPDFIDSNGVKSTLTFSHFVGEDTLNDDFKIAEIELLHDNGD